jgi:hypothetical protein
MCAMIICRAQYERSRVFENKQTCATARARAPKEKLSTVHVLIKQRQTLQRHEKLAGQIDPISAETKRTVEKSRNNARAKTQETK